ncbi:MAG: peptide deformylase [Candidatus Obscuribacterales bacterium]|nr:peptide deformylase [Candidatus Obscuribacterales bacterium]
MAIREILVYPNPELKKISQTVDSIDEEIMQLIADLEETMYAQPGCVGIAAPQTGALRRIVVIDSSRNPRISSQLGKMVLINPEVLEQEGCVIGREGCLSLPDFTGNVSRAQKIKVLAYNPHGQSLFFNAEDFEARLILHEIDHLDGILFIDRVSCLKTDVFRRKALKPPKLTNSAASSGTDKNLLEPSS